MLRAIEFRCTYCQSLIPWPIAKGEVGLKPEEDFQAGKLYPYEKCSCGWGKFIVCEGLAGGVTASIQSKQAEGRIRKKIDQARYARVPLDQIDPNPYQPRKFFDAEALRSLAESIRTVGLLEDIVVRPVGKRFQIVLGERRWRASRLAGAANIRVKVVDLEEEAARLISITENIHREDLTQVEEAFAYKGYVDEGKQLNEVGEYLGKMGDRVAERLKVLNTHHYIRYQEERIQRLQGMLEQLRGQQQGDHKASFETKVIAANEVTDYLDRGYDFVAALDPERIIVRRKLG